MKTTNETATETKSYGWAWAKVNCDFTNRAGSYRHYGANQFYELTADGVCPDDDAAKHFVFASSEQELLKAVSEYKRINKLI